MKEREKERTNEKRTRTHSLKTFFLLLSDLVMSLIRGCFSENLAKKKKKKKKKSNLRT